MQVIPLQAIPSQVVYVQLNDQACELRIFQYAFGMFMSVYVGGSLIIASVICENFVRIVRDAYLGFSGDFVFLDMQGTEDPAYTGLGGSTARFQLLYLLPSEVED